MSTRTSPWPAGIPDWADLATSDFAAAKAVYGEAFGWEIPDGNPQYGGYTNATRDGHNAAGVMPSDGPSFWTVYISSDDIDATAAAITANGGTVEMGPMELPGLLKMLIATDPQGARFGVNQAIGHIGAQITSQPGSIAWDHCVQPDPEAGMAFYGAVFGWVFAPIPGAEGGWTFSGEPGEPPFGSFGNMGPPTPASWQVTFAAESTDAVVEVFERAGGTTLMPAHDTPWGRTAMLSDAQGAVFTVMETDGNPAPER